MELRLLPAFIIVSTAVLTIPVTLRGHTQDEPTGIREKASEDRELPIVDYGFPESPDASERAKRRA